MRVRAGHPRGIRLGLGLVLAAWLAGCAHHGPLLPEGALDRPALARTARSEIGAPYAYRGETPQGFDCSGFVGWVYGRQGIRLPREVKGLVACGQAVPADRLKAGDLVFFKTAGTGRPSHVGIYLEDGNFIHAPSTGGTVKEDRLWKPYWKKHYFGARRIAW